MDEEELDAQFSRRDLCVLLLSRLMARSHFAAGRKQLLTTTSAVTYLRTVVEGVASQFKGKEWNRALAKVADKLHAEHGIDLALEMSTDKKEVNLLEIKNVRRKSKYFLADVKERRQTLWAPDAPLAQCRKASFRYDGKLQTDEEEIQSEEDDAEDIVTADNSFDLYNHSDMSKIFGNLYKGNIDKETSVSVFRRIL